MQCLAACRGLTAPLRAPSRASRGARLSRRVCVVVTAHDEADDILPIWSGKLPEHDPEKLPKARPLGGKTLGEELSLLHDAYVKDEEDNVKEMQAHLYSSNWEGDRYVGSNWNILTVLMGISVAVPLFGLLFALLSYGTLWSGHYYGI